MPLPSRFAGAVKGRGVCAVGGQELPPGTPIVAALCEPLAESEFGDALPGLGLVRRDYALEAWNDTEVPEGVVCHWRTTVPEPTATPRGLDEEVLLELLERLAERDDPAQEPLRLVVALVLLRRRRLRLIDRIGQGEDERWVLEHRSKDAAAWTVEVAARAVGDADAGDVAESLGELFGAEANGAERS
ncbi:MAG: hypothetical protein ACO3YY_05390 [Phycisphaerales bacterium]|jgi:hypothetical protein